MENPNPSPYIQSRIVHISLEYEFEGCMTENVPNPSSVELDTPYLHMQSALIYGFSIPNAIRFQNCSWCHLISLQVR